MLPGRPVNELSETPVDVIGGLLRFGVREHIGRRTGFHQFAIEEKGRQIRDAGRLLHVVCHNHDREVLLELEDQVLNP